MMRARQADLDLMLQGKKGEVKDLVFQLAAEIVTPEMFKEQMRSVLIRGHAQAGYLGRRRAGDMAPYDSDDTEYGRMVMGDQQPFLDQFVADISAGRYEGEDGRTKALPVMQRAGMYVDRMTGSANEAMLLASQDHEIWYWRLGAGVERHCEDCPQIAAGSPYRARDLKRVPGDGSTGCYSHCRCRISRGDGLTSFRNRPTPTHVGKS